MSHLEGIYEAEDGSCHGFPEVESDYPCSAIFRGTESERPETTRQVEQFKPLPPVWFDGQRWHWGVKPK